MGLESATYISSLNVSNPVGASDSRREGDDHLRLIKAVLKNTFPSAAQAYDNLSQAQAEDDTSTVFGFVSGQRLGQAIEDYWAAVTQPQAEDDTDQTTYEWTPEAVHWAIQGALGAALLKPSFAVDKSTADQNISSGVWTRITTWAERWDSDSEFDSSRHTPQTAGTYLYVVNVDIDPSSSGGDLGVGVYKNAGSVAGDRWRRIVKHDGSGNNETVLGAGLFSMNGSTDFVDFYAYQTTSGSEQVKYANGMTWWFGIRLGPEVT